MTHPYTVQLNRTGTRVQVSDERGRSYLLTPAQARSMAAELTRLAEAVQPGNPSRRHYGAASWQCSVPGERWFSTTHPGYTLVKIGSWHLTDPNAHRVDLQVTSLRSALYHALALLPEPVDGPAAD